ncbi:hypothetical protein L596_016456 [Steinernema carpocapsae]|uniref:Uncharacterized protein n=1 Tax=Steinernema carpocapsae TaxID=34508 RepID=A0A4U5NI11_STECR|nr:hypothetical protein L596_016456 [Steinernema carpocapsae]
MTGKANVSVEMEPEIEDTCCFGILNIKSGTIVFGVIWALISIITLCISIPSTDIPVANYSIVIGVLGMIVVVPLFMAVWMDKPRLLIPFVIVLVSLNRSFSCSNRCDSSLLNPVSVQEYRKER